LATIFILRITVILIRRFIIIKALALVYKDREQAELNSVETLNIFCNIANAYVQKSLYDSAFAISSLPWIR
jgi:hypothetical protein